MRDEDVKYRNKTRLITLIGLKPGWGLKPLEV